MTHTKHPHSRIDKLIRQDLIWQEQSYQLQRYPHQHRKELRAWDSADLYLLNTLMDMNLNLEHIVILHDQFGALAIPLASYKPTIYLDSWMSKRAIELNLEHHQKDPEVSTTPLDIVNDFNALAKKLTSSSVVIGKIPKQKNQFIALLKVLKQNLKPKTPLLLAGMDKHLSRSQYDLVAQHFGPTEFLPGVKKARIWKAYREPLDDDQPDQPKPEQKLQDELKPFLGKKIDIPQYQLRLQALPNVFSQDKLDHGSRFFLENFKQLPAKIKVTDLACGCGALGLAYLRLHPKAQLTFCDESFQAIMSCKYNLAHNIIEAQETAQIYADDGLKQMPANSQELILCNPPFHQQHTVSTDIANSLFTDAYRALKKEGELWIVANRHLNYHISLKKRFTHCVTMASNKKFVILKAIK